MALEYFCVSDAENLSLALEKIKSLRQKEDRFIGIIQDKSRKAPESRLQDEFDELFLGDALEILKGLFSVIEKSTHTQYPQAVICCAEEALCAKIKDLVASYQLRLIL
jgi:hypothetical protein